tara:strand:+ start:223 stop:510 length:288 start_codon:yes stop_codon:yes gene_type:complete
MDHPFFGDWEKRKKPTMSQGAADFCNGVSLNSQNISDNDSLIEDFQDKKKALKEMERSLSPEDLKIMAQSMGMGGTDPQNSVSSRFRQALNNKQQ